MTTEPLIESRGTESIAEGRWRIDPARSNVEFRTPTVWGLATVKGRFERYDGTLDMQRSPAIELTIDANSLTTKNGLRDRHLRSADFFDVANQPEIRFVSDSARLEGDRLKVRGRLSAAGESMPLELDASVRRIGDELELEARTDVDHRKLGMSNGILGMIPPPSALTVRGRIVR
jgi:polyisoprenoid-binding protein YceI